MNQDLPDIIEWHIFEHSNPKSPETVRRQAIHIGPFSTEEECRKVLASLNHIPGFSHGTLEVRQKSRRREKRIRIKLPIEISRLALAGKIWPSQTVDVSGMGARIKDPGATLKLGEVIAIRHGQRDAIFRVVWTGFPGTPTAGHIGVECLNPENNIWDLDFSARTDDEPLLQEIVVARAVQRRLFPRGKPALRTLDYCGKCVQARTVGGDYYDFLNMGNGRVGFVLADVSGKGVAAALVMANLQGSIHHRAGLAAGDLPGLLSIVNRHLYEHTDADRYTTLFFGCYDDRTRSLAYVSCGHMPALLLRASGTVERLQATGMVLGLFPEWSSGVSETSLQPGDVLGIYTDGITETMGADEQEFGEGRLLRVLHESRNLQPGAILKNVEQAVEQFREGEYPQDDLTLVVARAK